MARLGMLITFLAALAAILATAGAAQDDPALPSLPTIPGTPSGMMPRNLTCTSTLLGCMMYYQNATAGVDDVPLEMCCAPARKVMDGEMDCLCDGLNNPTLVASLGLDVKKGMTMFPLCGVKVPDNVCSSSSKAGDTAAKAVNGASQGTQFSYSSFLVFLFAMLPLLS